MSTSNQNNCTRLSALVPGYLDGELSEEQAAPLRRHLLSCLACRRGAADLTNLKRWATAATPDADFTVPAGFAARVAQSAFDGEPVQVVLQPQPAKARPGRVAAPVAETGILPFVLGLTSAAAALLISLSFLIGVQGQPRGSDLSAGEMPDLLPEVLRELDELNAKESRMEKAKRDQEILKEQGTFKR